MAVTLHCDLLAFQESFSFLRTVFWGKNEHFLKGINYYLDLSSHIFHMNLLKLLNAWQTYCAVLKITSYCWVLKLCLTSVGHVWGQVSSDSSFPASCAEWQHSNLSNASTVRMGTSPFILQAYCAFLIIILWGRGKCVRLSRCQMNGGGSLSLKHYFCRKRAHNEFFCSLLLTESILKIPSPVSFIFAWELQQT